MDGSAEPRALALIYIELFKFLLQLRDFEFGDRVDAEASVVGVVNLGGFLERERAVVLAHFVGSPELCLACEQFPVFLRNY